ncbi:MAG: ABC transporter permease [Muribaculaceae bacterium]|nr:ABC transporter permease [Muribaculaceae bacterium]
MIDLLHEIGQTLRNNRLRTILTGVSVSWGIFMLIVLLGASRGVANSFRDNMANQNTNMISFWNGITTKPYKGYEDGRYIKLKGADIEAIQRENADIVSRAGAYASVDTVKISTSLDVLSDGFEAVYPDALNNNSLKMSHGRFINRRDIDEARRVIVLSEEHARTLFGDDAAAVGKTVTALGLAWTVAGVYDHRWRKQSMVPYTAYKAVTGNTDDAYQIDVTVEGLKSEADGKEAERKIRATLSKLHTFDPGDKGAVWVWNRFSDYLTNAAAMGYLDLGVWVIGLFTLLSGIVGVSNIMFVSVRERTHEIGIRRAIGAKPREILTQILAESVAVTSLFGYIGIVLGTVVLQIIDTLQGESTGFKDPTVDMAMAAKVTVALIICGALAGLFPALKAIKVKPVEALRDE